MGVGVEVGVAVSVGLGVAVAEGDEVALGVAVAATCIASGDSSELHSQAAAITTEMTSA